MTAAGYDPKIIERFADQLLRKADTVRVGCAVGGGIFGVFVGAVPMTPLKSVWGIPAGFGVATIIVGALLGVLVGYVIGEGRAFRYRVQAQSAIFQLQIENRVASAVAEAVKETRSPPVEAAPASPPVSSAPAPPPPPIAQTAPPVTSVEPAPAPATPLLRPPGVPAPPSQSESDELQLPPLSPAANG
jgi:hypothetical protein